MNFFCLFYELEFKEAVGMSSVGWVDKRRNGMHFDTYLDQGSQPHIILAANAGIAVFSSWQPSIVRRIIVVAVGWVGWY